MTEEERLLRNKEIVLAFYDALINRKDFNAARPYMNDEYIQHNPGIRDGVEGLHDWLEGFKKEAPNLKPEIKRTIAEGDYVVLHVLGKDAPGQQDVAVVDIFRMEGDKIAEHWDVIQPIPAEDLSGNSMF